MFDKRWKGDLPPFPYGLDHVWSAFVELNNTRDTGMGLGPISYREIEAYRRQTLDDLTAWEVRLIRRLDDAVRGVIAKQKPKPESKEPEGIPVSDVKGIKALFAGIKARQQAKGNENG